MDRAAQDGERIAELIRAALAVTFKRSGRSREQIADGVTARLGYSVTKAMLDGYVAESRPANRFPLEMLPAWTEETGDRALLEAVLEAVDPQTATKIRYAEARIEAELAAAEAEGMKAAILRRNQ